MDDLQLTLAGPRPLRLDTFLRESLPGCSRRLLHALIDEGAVRVNGRRARKGDRVEPGDIVALPDVGALEPEPDLPVAVRYADPHLLVLEKPGGMPSHALDPRERGTVGAFVLGRYPETATVGDRLAPGLAHRLDTGTSGLLLAARTPVAHAALRRAFALRTVTKRYLAVVSGAVTPPPRIALALMHDPGDRRRMVPAAGDRRAWPAVTDFRVVATSEDHTLVEATMRTGVTHQIRAHLAAAGHAIIGDAVYGGEGGRLSPGRHALHASGLDFAHPATGTPLTFASSLPPDLAALVASEVPSS